MRCSEWLDRMEAYLDRELTAPEVQAIDKHLTSCPACRRALARRRALRELVVTELDVRAPKDLRAAILAAGTDETAAREGTQAADAVSRWGALQDLPTHILDTLRRRRLVPGLAGAAILVMAVGAWWLTERSAETTARAAFSEPGTVFVLRYGESPTGSVPPEMGSLILADPIVETCLGNAGNAVAHRCAGEEEWSEHRDTE